MCLGTVNVCKDGVLWVGTILWVWARLCECGQCELNQYLTVIAGIHISVILEIITYDNQI